MFLIFLGMIHVLRKLPFKNVQFSAFFPLESCEYEYYLTVEPSCHLLKRPIGTTPQLYLIWLTYIQAARKKLLEINHL